MSNSSRRSGRGLAKLLVAALLTSFTTVSASTPRTPAAVPLLDPYKAWTSTCSDQDGWDKPGPPFRIFGNSYYVGTCGIAAILITSPKGHILIDSGTEKGADVVLANIRALGFKPTDVAILLASHEHYDHVGGFAKLQEATGAKVFATAAAAQVLTTGQDSPDDPQYGMHPSMRPVKQVSVIREGQKVRYNREELVLTPLFTPGHTPGATSWQWQSCEGKQCRTIVFADSLSPISSDSYRFSDHPDYVKAFANGLAAIAAARCDVLLTPHPSASAMREKLQRSDLTSGGVGQCRTYAQRKSADLQARLAKEAQRGG